MLLESYKIIKDVKVDDIQFHAGEYVSVYDTDNNNSSYEIFLIKSKELSRCLSVKYLKSLRDFKAIVLDTNQEL